MSIVVSMLALLAIALFFVMRYKMNAAAAPFFVISLVVVLLTLFGVANMLVVGQIVLIALAVFALVYVFVIKKYKLREIAGSFFTPGLVFFVAACVFFAVVLSTKNAAFRYWDEWSFWGTAAKLVKVNSQLYTYVPSALVSAYPPGLPVWSYFVQFFTAGFSEWQLYFAYDVMIMAAFAILFSRVKWKNVATILVLVAFSVLGIYLWWSPSTGMGFYATAYADTQVGVVFGGLLVMHFRSENKNLVHYLSMVAGIMMITLVKDIGFAFAFIAAAVISFDMLVSGKTPVEFKSKKRKFLKSLIFPLGLFAAAILFYVLWAWHFKAATTINRVDFPYEYSALQIFTGQDPYFFKMLEEIWKSLSTMTMAIWGTQLETIVVFTIVTLLFALLAFDKKRSVRVVVFAALMLVGLAILYVFFAYLYTAIFYHTADYTLTSFNRYISSYYIGWLIAIAGIPLFDIGEPKWLAKWKKWLRFAPAVVFMAAMLFSTVYWNPNAFGDIFFASPRVSLESEHTKLIAKQAEKFNQALTYDDRIYFVAQEGDGQEYFMFRHEFITAYAVPSLGGGHFIPLNVPGQEAAIDNYDTRVDKAMFMDYLREQDVDYVYIHRVDDYFVSEFGGMFTDELQLAIDGSAALYRVSDNGGNNMMFQPVFSAEEISNPVPIS